MQSDSITSEALDVADRLEATRAAEVKITVQLQTATTNAQKRQLQNRLENISTQIASLAEEQTFAVTTHAHECNARMSDCS